MFGDTAPLAETVYIWLVRALLCFFLGMTIPIGMERLLYLLLWAVHQLIVMVTRREVEQRYTKADLAAELGQEGPLPANFDWHHALGSDLPKVVVQIPMFNDTAVCETAIAKACELRWPKDRLLVQVLDDSTDPETRNKVDLAAARWVEMGVQVTVQRRTNRAGYKAGALKQATESLTEDQEYVAIFDSDFEPEADLLLKMVPYLMANAHVGFVQARWEFKNPSQTLLTRCQQIQLNYHGKCEQWVRFASGSFVQFHGTAGIWRHATIRQVGGWMSRSTVEDMDLSLRAHCAGWKAIFLRDVVCLNELPAALAAYRKQQHRWTCGPMQLCVRIFTMVWHSELSIRGKLQIFLSFFFLHCMAPHIVALPLYGVLLPLTAVTPQIFPSWAYLGPVWYLTPRIAVLMWLPLMITFTSAAFTPWGFIWAPMVVLFENAMSVVKCKAVIVGLLGMKSAGEWVVTLKLGSAKTSKQSLPAARPATTWHIYHWEVIIGLYIMAAAAYGAYFHQMWYLAGFLAAQGFVFLMFGTNQVDCDALLSSTWDISWSWTSHHNRRAVVPHKYESDVDTSQVSTPQRQEGGNAQNSFLDAQAVGEDTYNPMFPEVEMVEV